MEQLLTVEVKIWGKHADTLKLLKEVCLDIKQKEHLLSSQNQPIKL